MSLSPISVSVVVVVIVVAAAVAMLLLLLQGHPTRKNRKNASNALFCFLVSFNVVLNGYFCELTLFDLFGCGS